MRLLCHIPLLFETQSSDMLDPILGMGPLYLLSGLNLFIQHKLRSLRDSSALG